MSMQRRTPASSSSGQDRDEHPTEVFGRPDTDPDRGAYFDDDYDYDYDYVDHRATDSAIDGAVDRADDRGRSGAGDSAEVVDEWEQALRGDEQAAWPEQDDPYEPEPAGYQPEPSRYETEQQGYETEDQGHEPEQRPYEPEQPGYGDHPTQVFEAVDHQPDGWDQAAEPPRRTTGSIYFGSSYPAASYSGSNYAAEVEGPADDADRYPDQAADDRAEERAAEREAQPAEQGEPEPFSGGLFGGFRGAEEDQVDTAIIPRIVDTRARRDGAGDGETKPGGDVEAQPDTGAERDADTTRYGAERAAGTDLGDTAEWKMDQDWDDHDGDDQDGDDQDGDQDGDDQHRDGRDRDGRDEDPDARTQQIPRYRPDTPGDGVPGTPSAAIAGTGPQPAVRTPSPRPKPAPAAETTTVIPRPAPAANKPRGSVALLVTLLVVALLGAGGAYYCFMQEREASRFKPSGNLAFVDKTATAQVREQVSRAVEAIYSYDSTQLDQSESRAMSFITGSYVDEFKRNFATVRQLGPQQKAALASTVAEAGLETLTERRATLLLMVNQVGRRADAPQPLKATVRLNVTAERVDGQWRVTGIEPR